MSDQTRTGSRSSRRPHKAGAFDVRTFIALLLGLYGLVLLVTSLVSTSEEDLAKTGGVNLNLWVGIGLLVAAGLFQGWAQWRPIVVPPDAGGERADGGSGAGRDGDEDGDPGSTG